MYKLILILLLLSFTANAQLGGDERIDSLESEIPNAKGDSNEVILYTHLSYHYSFRNTSKGISYAQKALDLAKELEWSRGILSSYNSLGLNYNAIPDYPMAIKYFLKAFKEIEDSDKIKSKAILVNNIGSIYSELSNHEKAIEYFEKSIKYSNESNYTRALALATQNMGYSLFSLKKHEEALNYFNQSLKASEEIGDFAFMANSMSAIGGIYLEQDKYDLAMGHFVNGLKISKELNNKASIAGFLMNLGELYYKIATSSIDNTSLEKNYIVSFNKKKNLNKSINSFEEAISIFESIGKLNNKLNGYYLLAKAYDEKGSHEERADILEKYLNLKDSIFTQDKEKEIASLLSVREKDIAEKQLRIQKLENVRRRNESYALYGGLALLVLVLFVIYRQRKLSDKLLLNILPQSIAKRLKKKEHPIADHFDNASVVFIDIVGFTMMSTNVKAERVVEVLNIIFTKFDEIANKYNLEKIKTIGDSYMAVSGVPIPDKDHAKNMAHFALQVKSEMDNYRTEDDTLIQFRIGIDSGDLMAGVIGTNKFIYDLWGDTVNTASRMESTSEVGKVHITENFKLELEKHKNGFTFSKPIEMDIKGKGMMKTYYLEGKINA